MSQKRLTWVDVTKGFLMILVVIGHYPGELDFPIYQIYLLVSYASFFLVKWNIFQRIKR